MKINHSNTQIMIHCKSNCPLMYPGETWAIEGRTWKKDILNNPGTSHIWYQDTFRHLSGHLQLIHAKRLQTIPSYNLIAHVRKYLYQRAYLDFKDTFSRGLFLTLVLGVGSELSNDDWMVFKDTGTAHLMVVSGAHLSLFMSMVEMLVKLFVHIYPSFIKKIPIKKLSSLIGLGTGFIYSWICGWGIPVQRAWFMALLGSFCFWGNRHFSRWQSWMYAMCLILLLEPHALWYPGFYLSFGTVGIFIWIAQSSTPFKWLKHLLSQFLCIVGLAPLSVLWFQNVPIIGFFTNFFAIPCISWVILPLSLVIGVTRSNYLIKLFEWINHYFHQTLSWAYQFKSYNLQLHWVEPKVAWLMVLLMMFMVYLPNKRIRIFLFVLVFVCCNPHPYSLQKGEFMSDFLDVGQGLAIFIKTKNHQLIYDTGGSGQFWTMADREIIPYLEHEHIKSIDKIIVSHPDLDHRGGLSRLMELFPNANIIVDKPGFYHFGKSCLHTIPWSWDGIRFEFLKVKLLNASKNNHSCVLKISNNRFKLLLTGDIEHRLEKKLLRLPIQATVLQVPHHGSFTSSTIEFLKKVKPSLAVVSVGLHNRYHLPNLKIIKRYQNLHIPWMSTADFGMIRIIFKRKKYLKQSWKSMMRYQLGL